LISDQLTDQIVRPVAIAVGAALGFNGSIGFIAQSMPGFSDNLVMQMLEKGGGWVVLLVVLWSYKRDWQRIADSEAAWRAAESASRAELIKILTEESMSKQAVAVALTANTEVLRQVSESLHNSTQTAATTAASIVAEAAKAAAASVAEAARVAATRLSDETHR
jgi:hypothetical protein